MPRIAVTGHMDLTPKSMALVRDAVDHELSAYRSTDLVGISCIARGADSIFAEAVLAAGGALEVVLPSLDYRQAKVKHDHKVQFDGLINKAQRVRVMPFPEANRAAYEAANDALLSSCDRLLAIWDGNESSRGGTGTVVEYARVRSIPITIIWPIGVARAK